MAHEIDMSNGRPNMFYVGAAPWHGLGTRFIEAPKTTEEAMRAGGLAWEVQMRPLFNEMQQLSTHKETFRADTGARLGVVGPKYVPFQNLQAFSFFDPLIQDGSLVYETAGSLQGGRKVWVLAKAKGDAIDIVPGDAVERYVLLSNSHDGTLAIRVGFTPIRVVCQNTLAMSMANKDSKLLRVRHTTNVDDALEQIRDIMNVADASFVATSEQFKALARCNVNAADVRKYVEKVFGIKSEEEATRESKTLATVIALFEGGRGADLGVKGTAWKLYNAAQEAMQYELGRTPEGRLTSLWFGQNAKRNRDALEVAVEMFVNRAA